jgi:two-component system response regulator AtoC
MPGIVIIEEDQLMQELLAEWLAAEGYPVRTWDGSMPAGAAETDAELVIVDIFMPRSGGAEKLRAVRAAFPNVPIVAISTHFRSGLAGDGAAARALGVRQVIPKPFRRTDLLMAVRAAVAVE